MKEFMVRLKTLPDIKRFVNTANKQKMKINIFSGQNMADAKSMIAVFALEMTEQFRIEANGTDAECEAFIREIEEFVVDEVST